MSSIASKPVDSFPTLSLAAVGQGATAAAETRTNSAAQAALAQTPAAGAGASNAPTGAEIVWNLPPKLSKMYGYGYQDCWWRAIELLYGDQFEKAAKKYPDIVKLQLLCSLCKIGYDDQVFPILQDLKSHVDPFSKRPLSEVFSSLVPSSQCPTKLFKELADKTLPQEIRDSCTKTFVHLFANFTKETTYKTFYDYLQSLDEKKRVKLKTLAINALNQEFFTKLPETEKPHALLLDIYKERRNLLSNAEVGESLLTSEFQAYVLTRQLFPAENTSLLAQTYIYRKLGLAIVSQKIEQSFEALMEELKRHPLLVGGSFSSDLYTTPPKQFEVVNGSPIYGWPKGTPRKDYHLSGHAIVLIGAKKIGNLQIVYYLDPSENLQSPEMRKVYCMSYSRFQSSLYSCANRRIQLPPETDPGVQQGANLLTQIAGVALYKR